MKNCDPQDKKRIRPLATGAGEKSRKENQQRAGRNFFSLQKMLDAMAEILASLFGRKSLPQKDNKAFLGAFFCRGQWTDLRLANQRLVQTPL